MKLLLLFTPPHSGTHFARLFFELHPAIDWWRPGALQHPDDWMDAGRYLTALVRGEATAAETVDALRDFPTRGDHVLFTRRWADWLNLDLRPKNPDWLLVHLHTAPRWRDDPESLRNGSGGGGVTAAELDPLLDPIDADAMCVTLLDPLRSVLTSLARYGAGFGEDSVPVAYRTALSARSNGPMAVVPVDKRGEATARLMGLLSRMGLDLVDAQREYLRAWPRPNPTFGSDARKIRGPDSAPWIPAARELLHRGIVAEQLQRYVYQLVPLVPDLATFHGYHPLAWAETNHLFDHEEPFDEV